MGINIVLPAKIEAVDETDAATEFTTTGPFVIYGDKFLANESAYLMQEYATGYFRVATNKDGPVMVSAYPNTARFDAKGTFRIKKDTTKLLASVGYEEQ